MNPIVTKLIRKAGKDLFIPLSRPIQDKNGRTVNEVFLRKGMRLFGIITVYNR